jgi:hypothetical protein
MGIANRICIQTGRAQGNDSGKCCKVVAHKFKTPEYVVPAKAALCPMPGADVWSKEK